MIVNGKEIASGFQLSILCGQMNANKPKLGETYKKMLVEMY